MVNSRNLVLLLAYVIGLGWLAYELQRPRTSDQTDATGIELTAPAIPTRVASNATIDAYAAIVERPLFNADRRPTAHGDGTPSPQAVTAQTDNSADLAGVRLSAVLKSSDSLTALIEMPNGSSRSVQRGDMVGGWEVAEILDDRIVVTSDGKQNTLRVYDFSNVPIIQRRPPTRRSSNLRTRRIPRRAPRPTQIQTQDVPDTSANPTTSPEAPRR